VQIQNGKKRIPIWECKAAAAAKQSNSNLQERYRRFCGLK
jgi:hypothetical protein